MGRGPLKPGRRGLESLSPAKVSRARKLQTQHLRTLESHRPFHEPIWAGALIAPCSGAESLTPMHLTHTMGPIEHFMVEDHARIDRLLSASLRDDGSIAPETYAQFRRDLLRHIAMEEKILLRYAKQKRCGEPLPLARQLRVDHGEIAKLLVPSPTPKLVAALCELLGRHNALEEGPGALYACCDALALHEAPQVVAQLRALPAVPVAPHYDAPEHQRISQR